MIEREVLGTMGSSVQVLDRKTYPNGEYILFGINGAFGQVGYLSLGHYVYAVVL